jgi:hypothetical protein
MYIALQVVLLTMMPASGVAVDQAATPLVFVADSDTNAALTSKAAKCNVSSYRFSKNSADRGTPIMITTSTDGWCWSEPRNKSGGFAMKIQDAPSHGQAVVMTADSGRSAFSYKPATGYVGPDSFNVYLYATGQILNVSVNVVAP